MVNFSLKSQYRSRMSHPIITKNVLDFLNDLKKNNNRDWFEENKNRFKSQQTAVKKFFQEVMDLLKTHDSIEKMKVFRIYRDIRFSKDKTPYKYNFSASFTRMGAERRGGYYLHIQPGGSFIATGFWNPEKEDLHRIRKEFEVDTVEIRKIINDPDFMKIWGSLEGEELKTAPKGFDKEDPNIDLIRKKQYIFMRKFTDEEVLSPDFLETINGSFMAIRPYFDLMSAILTTNLNGESLLD